MPPQFWGPRIRVCWRVCLRELSISVCLRVREPMVGVEVVTTLSWQARAYAPPVLLGSTVLALGWRARRGAPKGPTPSIHAWRCRALPATPASSAPTPRPWCSAALATTARPSQPQQSHVLPAAIVVPLRTRPNAPQDTRAPQGQPSNCSAPLAPTHSQVHSTPRPFR